MSDIKIVKELKKQINVVMEVVMMKMTVMR
jgi:hypothetical protein